MPTCVYGYDDEEVVTADGVVDVDGVKVAGSRSFVRDVRLTSPEHARRAAAEGRTVGATPGRKPEGKAVIVRKGVARRWVNGVCVQTVALTRGKLHAGTVEILRRRGYRVVVR